MSYLMGDRNQTQAFSKSNKYSEPLSYLSSPDNTSLLFFFLNPVILLFKSLVQPGFFTNTHNPSAPKAKAGRSWVQGQAGCLL